MSKQIEALKLALEGLEYIHEGANNQGPHTGISWRCVSNKAEPAITAIREALAEQPAQQEPVAIKTLSKIGKAVGYWRADLVPPHIREDSHEITPLYTSPPASKPWVGLTEFDIDQIPYGCSHADSRLIAYAIEAKLREKNAQPSKPLTDEQIIQLAQEWPAETNDWASHIDFARAIEAAHGITGETK